MYKSIKHDDRGLSLVELLVAVVILAAVAIPLGRSFVTAARIAARSEAMGDAAEAARNVAEAVAAMDMDEIYFKMNETNATLLDWRVTDAATYSEAGAVNPSNPMDRSDPVYRFNLQGVEYASRQYDAVVTLRADPDKNNASIPQYTPMDAVFNQGAQPQEPDAAAGAYFQVQAAHNGTPGEIQRSIVLTLYGNETGVSADIAYNYICNVTPTGGEAHTFDVSRSYSVVGESDIDDDGKAPAVYIMYNPYNLPSDIFTINCSSVADVTFPVFLVAQQPQNGYTIGVTVTGGNAEIYSNATTVNGNSKIYASEPVDRLYSVTVELYAPGEAGTGEIIYTLDTAKMD